MLSARTGWPDEGTERSLQAEVMDWADDLTYAVHDVDDFFRAGLVPLDRLAVKSGPNSPEGKRLAALLLEARDARPDAFPPYAIGELVEAACGIIALYGPTTPYEHTTAARAEMRVFGSRLITRYLEAFSLSDVPGEGKTKLVLDETARREVEALKMLVVVYVVLRPALAVVQKGQMRLISELFEAYFDASRKGGDRRLFPPSARERLDRAGETDAARARVVVDLISGLTETAAVQLHQRLMGGWTGPTLDAMATIG
jgi:dGTPase